MAGVCVVCVGMWGFPIPFFRGRLGTQWEDAVYLEASPIVESIRLLLPTEERASYYIREQVEEGGGWRVWYSG